MEKIKEPAVLVSTANLVMLVGAVVYFYRQGEALKLEQVKLANNLIVLGRKVAEIEKVDQNKGEALHSLNTQVKDLNSKLDSVPSFDTFNDLDLDVDELVAVLEENNILCARPSQEVYRPRKPATKGGPRSAGQSGRRVPSSARDDRNYKRDSDDYRKPDRSERSDRSDRSERYERSERDSYRGASSARESREPQDFRRDPDDVSDLISEFRSQTSLR